MVEWIHYIVDLMRDSGASSGFVVFLKGVGMIVASSNIRALGYQALKYLRPGLSV
ncbi:MAG TPA: hypothetical protein VF659_02030 [Pyrinomonadaceae bacterium]|jgi:hypothetical protein